MDNFCLVASCSVSSHLVGNFFDFSQGWLPKLDLAVSLHPISVHIPGCSCVMVGLLPLFQWAAHHLRLEEMGSRAGRAVKVAVIRKV